MKESKEQINSLITKLEEASNSRDQKEFEIVDMKLKLDQYMDVDGQNVSSVVGVYLVSRLSSRRRLRFF